MVCIIAQRSTIMALPLLFFFCHLLSPSPQYLLYAKKPPKKPLHKSELLFKDCESLVFLVSVDCNRMPEQVDHSLHPNGSHCYFERADICWRAERGSFQRNDESPVLDCSERGPHEWMRTWQKGWKGERKRFQTANPISFSMSFYPSHTLYFHSLYFCFYSVHLRLLCQQF